MNRRELLASSHYLAVAAALGGCGTTVLHSRESNLSHVGPLEPPDANGIRLPRGFSSRIVATSGTTPVADSDYVWHGAPDGGAVFDVDGGWIYVSNCELAASSGGITYEVSRPFVNTRG